MGLKLIHNAFVVNEGSIKTASVIINDDIITGIYPTDSVPKFDFIEVIDASGKYLFPGVIDDHVHFREPGLTHKGTISSESHAAAAGGVTSVFDMPNCIPQTITINALHAKQTIASTSSIVNYSFYLGATKNNLNEISEIDPKSICGIKLFMGSSTGDMLLDNGEIIRDLFQKATIPVAAHCEDSTIINSNISKYTKELGCEPPISYHPLIRSAEACYASTYKALEIASGTNVQLHILHISTAKELSLFSKGPIGQKQFTAEACPAHLYFSESDYDRLGARIKCNPAIKSISDRQALHNALTDGNIDIIGTDHAPHLLSEKIGGCLTAASGMPILPYSLPIMLELSDTDNLTLPDIARLMSHNPATLFKVKHRGYIREGYKADLTLVSRSDSGYTVNGNNIYNKCQWSPFEGVQMHWKVEYTWVNGNQVYCEGRFNDKIFGEQIEFSR
jgi:dihydroorotase